nr:glycosyltransferase family 4 protein [uncultured Draconibacterium sp.]
MGKLKVLYIAKNIPTPRKKTNRVIFDIAKNLSSFCTIQFLFPKEIVPFWLRNSAKFSYLKGLKNWSFENFSIQAIPYIKLPFKPMQYWPLFYLPPALKRYINNDRPDLVHAHYLFPDGYMAYRIWEKTGIPYVITFRNQDKQYLEIISNNNPDFKKAKKILSAARQILVTNGGYQEFIEKKFGIKCIIMPHGIESSVLKNGNSRKKNEAIIITTVAEAINRKNIDWIIRACLQYKGNKEIRLNIIGDGPELENLKHLAINDNRITFKGRVEHAMALQILGESDIFALPSYNETFGLVYLEAAATHNAMIGLKGEGVWGVFEEDKEMLFCGNFEGFKQQLHRLIENDVLRTEITEEAFKKVKTMEWEKVQTKYKSVYLNALK